MLNYKERYKTTLQLNFTSMTDLVFTLLFVFVITAPLMHAQVDLKLPKSAAAKQKDESAVTVSVTKAGGIFIGKTPLTIEEFPDKIKQLVSTGGITTISLKGDEGVDYGLIMRVVGYIKEAGIEDLGLVAIPEKKKK